MAKNRPHIKMRVLWIFAIVFLVLAAGLFYVNKVLLPVQVKDMVVKAAQEQLGRKVTLETLQWGPLRGFAISELTIYSKDDPEEIFLHIKNASAQVLFLPIIQKKIILPSVVVDALSLRLVKKADGTWNVSDLIKPPASPQETKGTLPGLVVSGFAVTNARVKIVDLSGPQEFSEMIEPVNIKGSLSLVAGLHISGDIALPATAGGLKFTSRTGLRDGSFTGECTLTNIALARYTRFVPTTLPVALNTLTIKEAALTAEKKDQVISVSGTAILPGLDIGFDKGRRITGDLALDKAALTLDDGKIIFQGNVSSAKTKLDLDPQQKITGDLRAQVDKLLVSQDETAFAGTFSGQNVRVNLDSQRSASGHVKASNVKASLKAGQLTGSGNVEIEDIIATAGPNEKLTGNIILNNITIDQAAGKLTATADIQGKGLAVTSAGISVRADIALPAARTVVGPNLLDISASQARVTRCEAALPNKIIFSGDSKMSLRATLNNNALSYSGTEELLGGELSGLPTAGTVNDIRGTITITPERIETQDLSLKIFDTPVAVTGTVTALANPELDLTATAPDVNLSLAEKVIPQIMKDQGLTATGKADITLRLKGPASKLGPETVIATVQIKGAKIESAKLKQALSNITGIIRYTPPSVSWKGLSAEFQGKTYLSSGSLVDFSAPLVEGSLKTDDLALDFKAQKTGETLRLERLTGTWFDSTVSASGRLDLPPEKEPVIDITGQAKVVLVDLPKMIPQQADTIDKLKLGGTVKIDATIKGAAADWQHWDSKVSLQTPEISVMGYKIEDITLNSTGKEGVINPLEIKGRFYDGDFGIIASLDTTSKDLPFDTTFKLERMNLELLKRETPLKDRQLAGLVAGTGALKGTAADWKNISGKTTVQITQGYLWELSILSNLLNILSSSFQGGDLIVTDASATLAVGEGKISTNNLTMKSATVTLLGEGWVDLDQNIDFNVTPRIEPKTPGSTNPLEVLNPTSGLLNIRITGTLQKPQFKHNIAAPTIIKKTLQNTVGNLLKIFE